MKTRKSLAKRVRLSKKGKLMRRRMSSQHLARRKSRRARKIAGQKVAVYSGDAKLLRRFLPFI